MKRFFFLTLFLLSGFLSNDKTSEAINDVNVGFIYMSRMTVTKDAARMPSKPEENRSKIRATLIAEFLQVQFIAKVRDQQKF